MIQRIQTIWLLLAGVFCTLQLVLPMISVASQPLSLFLPTVLLKIFGACGLLIALLAIFWYKNRTQQLRWCYGMVLLQISAYICTGWFLRRLEDIPTIKNSAEALTFIFPAITIIFAVLAIVGIRKDEKKVRAADRLR
ncbi:MAG: DUF4293 domain-containing protein [Dysgonamonadaceae bacterium]|jgi:succinate-acetate transporter protein|nr:DUF4293 domain-containing protein [Dysgonamonadaceae bacterium]